MNMRKNDVKVCLTTELFNSYNNLNTTVVVVDLLRATSVISTAFHYGIESIIPVMSLDEALSYKNKPKHIIAAERNTLLIDGFEFGNSPFHYIDKNLNIKWYLKNNCIIPNGVDLSKFEAIKYMDKIKQKPFVFLLESFGENLLNWICIPI